MLSQLPTPLADDEWFKSSPIDILFGADIIPALTVPNSHTCTIGSLIATETVFGWTLMGRLPTVTSLISNAQLDNSLKRFWELEEMPKSSEIPPDEAAAEDAFQRSITQLSNGQFMVALPFRHGAPNLGESRDQANRRMWSMEKRFLRDPEFQSHYVAFMKDYLQQQHMRLITPEETVPVDAYYIPHHGIFRSGEPKKIRVVFDASSKTSNGRSLNDELLIGPKLQPDIMKLLLQFRVGSICFSCDIRQMYRQILIVPEHRHYQLIQWRFDPQQPMDTYALQTVSYGLASSPFLALRTLQQLADQHKHRYPLGASALTQCTYVDDILCTADDVQTALRVRNELQELLFIARLELRKWSSNNSAVLTGLPADHCVTTSAIFQSPDDHAIKILGLRWRPTSDAFYFDVHTRPTICTKRNILSEVARIFDPIGFLAPLSLQAKKLIQRLWTAGIGWDEEPPADVVRLWNRFQSELPHLSSVQITRYMGLTSEMANQNYHLHGFCDASTIGYAAVVYLRIHSDDGTKLHLLAAKSKVASLKQTSLPRLELQAAVLLSDLLTYVAETLDGRGYKCEFTAWTDSTVALSWIKSPSYRWQTFVANRVAHIQSQVPPDRWRHVPTKLNPADPASRGLFPSDLVAASIWWDGPPFLHRPPAQWPVTKITDTNGTECAEEKSKTVLLTNNRPTFIDELIVRYSTFTRLQRITAYILRFNHNLTHPDRRAGPLSASELDEALNIIIRQVQHQVFRAELSALRRSRSCTRAIQRLLPYIDDAQLIRVGGRLHHANVPEEAKHPILLPASHALTKLIIRHIHCKYFHVGLTNCQHLLLQRYWVLSARRAIRSVIFNCVKCYRLRPRPYAPLMADLPSARVIAAKPFSRVGVDFAGPFLITLSRHRGVKSQKAYLCIFICFSTKAVHLELVSDLTTSAFLAALRRFIARRGRCHTIYSDRGTNFVGAYRELCRLFRAATDTEVIDWKFNPPSAPHFGALWESNIKCIKHHLNRVIGSQLLTYEEFSTLLCQVEAILNSRPLTVISSDPTDPMPLTPGHFLTLAPLTAVPAPDVHGRDENLLTRWQLIERLHQDFWRRWQTEYLHTLQQRSKWLNDGTSPAAGTTVILKSDVTPPAQWKLGVITAVHPGPDGRVRVATVRTAAGDLIRPLIKLCPLPFTFSENAANV